MSHTSQTLFRKCALLIFLRIMQRVPVTNSSTLRLTIDVAQTDFGSPTEYITFVKAGGIVLGTNFLESGGSGMSPPPVSFVNAINSVY
jgi:hypothetical protein